MTHQQLPDGPATTGLGGLLRSGDLVAAERLVEVFGAPSYRLLAELTGSWESAERMVQPALLAVWRDRGHAPGDADLPGFVLGHVAATVSDEPVVQRPDADLAAATAPLAVLDERQRTAWVLHHWHALDVPQIAHALHTGRRPASEVLAGADAVVGSDLPAPVGRPLPGSVTDRLVLALGEEPDTAVDVAGGMQRRRTLLVGAGIVAVAVAATAFGLHPHHGPAVAPTASQSSGAPAVDAFDGACRARVQQDARQGVGRAVTGTLTVVPVDAAHPDLAELLHDDANHLVLCTGDGSLTYPDSDSPWPVVTATVPGVQTLDYVAAGPALPGHGPTSVGATLVGDPVTSAGHFWTWHRQVRRDSSNETPQGTPYVVLRGTDPIRSVVVPWQDPLAPGQAGVLDAHEALTSCRRNPGMKGAVVAATTGSGGLLRTGDHVAVCAAGSVVTGADVSGVGDGGVAAMTNIDDATGALVLAGAGPRLPGMTSGSLDTTVMSTPVAQAGDAWGVEEALPVQWAGVMPTTSDVRLRRADRVLESIPVLGPTYTADDLPRSFPVLASGAALTQRCPLPVGGSTVTSTGGHVLVHRGSGRLLVCAADAHSTTGSLVVADSSAHEGFALHELQLKGGNDNDDSGTPTLLFGGGALPRGVDRVRYTSAAGTMHADVHDGMWVYEQVDLDGVELAPTSVTLDGPHVHRVLQVSVS